MAEVTTKVTTKVTISDYETLKKRSLYNFELVTAVMSGSLSAVKPQNAIKAVAKKDRTLYEVIEYRNVPSRFSDEKITINGAVIFDLAVALSAVFSCIPAKNAAVKDEAPQ
jgi:hypothetical protein